MESVPNIYKYIYDIKPKLKKTIVILKNYLDKQIYA